MKINLKSTDRFEDRHIGPSAEEQREMLNVIGADSLETLVSQTIPAAIRSDKALQVPEALSEFNYLNMLRKKMAQNKLYKTYIGLGYYGTVVPPAIQRNILENPGWYTQYTPYQAEISQGRLEALLNFQTMVSDLTGLEIANASLLDEGTGAAEAMIMFYNEKNKRNKGEAINKFLVSNACLPQTIDILKTRAIPLGIELVISDHTEFTLDDTVFGICLQYPNVDGEVVDYTALIGKAQEAGIFSVVAADLMSLVLLKSPGAMGADVATGNTQRFGVPLGYGGPHAAYFSTKDNFKRQIPGRIIGVSVDTRGEPALRMALQTREQHIKREKATSNICTAQALLAIMAGMYGVYHGPEGLQAIATRIHLLTKLLDSGLQKLGYTQTNTLYFDTLCVDLGEISSDTIRTEADAQGVNFHIISGHKVSIALDETVQPEDLDAILNIFAKASSKPHAAKDWQTLSETQIIRCINLTDVLCFIK